MMTLASVILDWIYIPLTFAYCWHAMIRPNLKRQERAIKIIIVALIVASLDLFADFVRGADGMLIALDFFSVIVCVGIAIMAEFTLRNNVKSGKW